MLFDKIVLLVMLGAIITPFAIAGALWAVDKILERGRKKVVFHNMCMECKKFGVSCNDTIGTEPAPECFVPKTSEECKRKCITCKYYIPHKNVYGIGYCKNISSMCVAHDDLCTEYEKKEGNFLC